MTETKPRYTVELTTEGWQIKDNAKGTIRADVYPSKREAEDVVGMFDSIDEAEGQGRR